MKSRIIIKTLFVLILIVSVSKINAQDTLTKKYNKSFEIKEKTVLKIVNKYGKVHIENHDKATAEIEVTVTVQDKKKEKNEKAIEDIKIKFEKSGNLASAITDFKSSIKCKKFKIDYVVKMPATLELDLTSSYGHIFIDKLKSESSITISYGTFTINELTTGNKENKTLLQIKYSKGDISKSDFIKMNIKYSKIEIYENKYLAINSKYSNIKLKKAGFINGNSKYDPVFKVDEVEQISLVGAYSGYNIKKLNDKLTGDLKYSSIEIKEIKEGFSKIKIEAKYGNININAGEKTSYTLNANAEYGSLHYPESAKIEHKNNTGQEKNISAKIGSVKKGNSEIFLNVKYGNITVN